MCAAGASVPGSQCAGLWVTTVSACLTQIGDARRRRRRHRRCRHRRRRRHHTRRLNHTPRPHLPRQSYALTILRIASRSASPSPAPTACLGSPTNSSVASLRCRATDPLVASSGRVRRTLSADPSSPAASPRMSGSARRILRRCRPGLLLARRRRPSRHGSATLSGWRARAWVLGLVLPAAAKAARRPARATRRGACCSCSRC